MPSCAVFCCKRRSNTSNLKRDGVSFHLFPKDRYLRDIWTRFCNNQLTWVPARTSNICSDHFKTSDYKTSGIKRRLVEDAIPSLLPHCVCSTHQIQNDGHFQSCNDPLSTTPTKSTTAQNVSLEEIPENGIGNLNPTPVLTIRERNMKLRIENQRKIIKRLQSKNRYLKKKVADLEQVILSHDEVSLDEGEIMDQ